MRRFTLQWIWISYQRSILTFLMISVMLLLQDGRRGGVSPLPTPPFLPGRKKAPWGPPPPVGRNQGPVGRSKKRTHVRVTLSIGKNANPSVQPSPVLHGLETLFFDLAPKRVVILAEFIIEHKIQFKQNIYWKTTNIQESHPPPKKTHNKPR